MEFKKEKIKGAVATVIIHGLLLLLLILIGLSLPESPQAGGVEVDLGYTDYGRNIDKENNQAAASTPTTPPTQEDLKPETEDVAEQETEEAEVEKVQEEDVITQDIEHAPAVDDPEEENEAESVPDENKIKEQKDKEQKEKQQEQQQVQEQEEQAKETPEETEPEQPKIKEKSLYKGPVSDKETGESGGDDERAGDPGKPNGTPGAENEDGKGGSGDGFDVNLGDGRGYQNIPLPIYNSDDQGKIVVKISVDRDGRVVNAIAGAQGTTNTDSELWKQAEQAALRAKFDSETDPSKPEIQQGTITYFFIKMK
ncbi:MAG: energy transducer TonB [Bacteroidales bacterium]|nr:energy transducer TonB [Bacteroidales bacterium]